jgi:Flp pilus assembly protein TadG
MNKKSNGGKLSAVSYDHRWRLGQSAVEFALAVPVLALLLVAAADFGRVFFYSIAVNNAARAGAQYGSQSVIAAANPSGMATAAVTDGADIPGIAATASQCTCESPAGTVKACAASYCGANGSATFVEVDTSATFTTLVNYPGLTNSFTLTGKAIMQVQQE